MKVKAWIITAAFFVVLAFSGFASADPYAGGVPLTTAKEGVVSGELWFDHSHPMVTNWTKDSTLPLYNDVQWAQLYVAVYCGHMQNNYPGRANITFNGVQLGGTPDGLSSEEFNVSYSYPGAGGTGPVWVNDHCVRVTSDYLMWYNVTDIVNPDSDVWVKTWPEIGSSFDGRIKAVTLVVAYNDGDSDTIYYWVNQGHDLDTYYYTGNYIGETNFNANLPFGSSVLNANLTVVHMASSDGIYTFNGISIPTDPDSTTTPPGENWQGAYSGYNIWDASSLFNSNSNNYLTYDRTADFFKIILAFLTAHYTEGEWYWKDYNGEEEGGYMPDFDQNQDFDGVAGIEKNYCAPAAEANSLWWFAQKYPDREVIPPGVMPQQLIQELAWLMDTNGQKTGILHAGTYVEDEQAGVEEYLIQHGLTDILYEHTELKPEFGWIEAEIERCQDVKLDLGFYEVTNVIPIEPGFWHIEWRRIGGHAVTAAGVDSENFMIAISDPDADNAEFGLPGVIRGPNHAHGGVPFHDPAYDHTPHNDGVSASHDIYNAAPSISPGGLWALTDPYWRQQDTAYQYYDNNGGTRVDVTDYYGEIPPEIGEIHTEIEAAVVVSPVPCTPGIEVKKTVWDPVAQAWVKEINANMNDIVRFRLWVHNNGTCCDLTNITVTDILSSSLNYSGSAAVNGYPYEPDEITYYPANTALGWSFPGAGPQLVIENITYPANHTKVGYFVAEIGTGDPEPKATMTGTYTEQDIYAWLWGNATYAFSNTTTEVDAWFHGSDYNDGIAKFYVDGNYAGEFDTMWLPATEGWPNPPKNWFVRITGLPAGAHTLTVSQSGSGCISIDALGVPETQFTEPLAPYQNITIEFDAQVVKCGNDTNIVNATAWCGETMVSGMDSASENVPCSGTCGDVDGQNGVTIGDGIQVAMSVIYGTEEYPLADPWAADIDCANGITIGDGIQVAMSVIYGTEEYPLECCS